MEFQIKKDVNILQNNQPIIVNEQYECVLNNNEAAQYLLTNNLPIVALIPDAFWLLQYCAMPPLEPEHAFNYQKEYYTNNAIGIAEAAVDEAFGIKFKLVKDGYLYTLIKRIQAPLLCIQFIN
jgi:hypothetical protein